MEDRRMRKHVFLMLCGYLCVWLLTACHQKKPEIRFESYSHNFGTILIDTMVTHAFVYRNCGSAPLRIDRVKTTCGCTGFSHAKRPILPNDTGVINVHYYPDATGTFRKIAVVYSNATDSPMVILKINGFVKKRTPISVPLKLGPVKY